ncbi:uncharacterized protein PWA37_001364 [Arxiozyma heterogenica]|uniref:uncharacterized protein n=1 Tax=Arxiozyma heterogenica TaxID=278026 RepID=UPI002EFDBDC2
MKKTSDNNRFLPIKNNRDNIKLVQTYYVPQEQITILSASKLYDETTISLPKGYNTLETSEGERINTLIKNDSIWVKAEEIIDMLKDKVYHIRPENPVVHKSTMELEEAHIRLNHIPKRIITERAKKNIYEDVSIIKDTNKEEDWCATFISGKMTYHFHNKNAMNYYNKNKLPGESWSINVFGPINGLQVNQHRKVNLIINYKGTAFPNIELKEVLKDMGIQLILTPIQVGSNNARAKRNICSIINDIKRMLLQSRIQFRFWKYAVQAAVDIRNCYFNRTINEAPLQSISNIKSVIQLRSFLPFAAPASLW